MACIRSRGNKDTELALVRLLRAGGIIGWRRHATVFGKPDFIFRAQKLAVFVDGCFWHGCRYHCRLPASNESYWHPKILRNQLRDKSVTRELRKRGWRVLRIWEHELRKPERVINRITTTLIEPKNV